MAFHILQLFQIFQIQNNDTGNKVITTEDNQKELIRNNNQDIDLRAQVLRHFNSECNLSFKIPEDQQNCLSVIFMRIFYTFYSKKLDMIGKDTAKLFEVIEFIALNFIRLDKREVKSLCPEQQLTILLEVGKFLKLYGNNECTLKYYNTLEMDFHRTFSKQFIKLYEQQALNLNKIGKPKESIAKYNLALNLQEQEDQKQLKIHDKDQINPQQNQGEFASSISATVIKNGNEEHHAQDQQMNNDPQQNIALIDKGLISYQVAQIYTKLKEFDKAIEYYKKSLEYNLNNKDRLQQISHKSFGSYINLHKQEDVSGIQGQKSLHHHSQNISRNSFEQADLHGTRSQFDNNVLEGNKKNKELRNCSILQNISNIYFQNNDFDSALLYLQKAYEIYQNNFKLTEQTKYIKLLTQMCNLLSTKGDFTNSIIYAEETLALVEQKYGTSNYKELNAILENLQVLYLNSQKVDQSLQINKRLIKLVEENNLDDVFLAQYLETNGILNYKLQNYEESLRSSYFALRMYKERYGEKSIEVAKIQQNIAQTLSQQQNHKVAFEMGKNCLEIFSQNTDKMEQEELSYVLYNMAQFALNVDLKDNAFNYIKQSKELLEKRQGKALEQDSEIMQLFEKIYNLINQSSIR